MSRTTSFDCPHCKLRHNSEIVYGRSTRCGGRPVYFDDAWRPSSNEPPGFRDRSRIDEAAARAARATVAAMKAAATAAAMIWSVAVLDGRRPEFAASNWLAAVVLLYVMRTRRRPRKA
jgi:hypothetical protein